MKIDRFVKVMLILISGLLFLNCIKDLPLLNSNSNSTKSTSTPFLEIPVKASIPPAFIQKGKFYNFFYGYNYAGQQELADKEKGKVLEIDKDSGWVRIEFYDEKWTGKAAWINIDQVRSCWEETMPAQTSNSNK